MTTQILFPAEFDNLSDDDKKLVEDLMKSIVKAEEATNILLDLLGSENLDSDLPKFRETCQQHFNKNLNLEILTSDPTPILGLSNSPSSSIINNIKTFVEFLMGKSNAFKKAAKARCQQICENDPNPQKCIKCLKSLKSL